MKILFKKENLKTTLVTLIYWVLGVLFCVIPLTMFNVAESILCSVLLGVGMVCIVLYALMPQEDKILKLLIYGIISVGLGLCMLMFQRFFGIILSIIAGFGGLMLFIEAIKERKNSTKSWITKFVIGLIVVLLAITAVVLGGTNAGKNILSIFYGIMLLTQAICGIVQLVIIVKKNKHNLSSQQGNSVQKEQSKEIEDK